MQRHTQQADEFLALLNELVGPFSVDDVSAHLAEHAHELSRATLFRYLKLAVASEQLRLVPHLGGDRFYERANAHHHHLACPNCERVLDVNESCSETNPDATGTIVRTALCANCTTPSSAWKGS